MAKILITGANGFLGQHLAGYLHQRSHEIIAQVRNEPAPYLVEQNIKTHSCELTHQMSSHLMMARINPDIVIHTAARSKPDDCEQNKAECEKDNYQATAYLAQGAKEMKTKQFIFLSTDFVFGDDGPHSENDIPNPLNFYGATKLKAEREVKRYTKNSCIVRPVFMYGPVYEGMRGCFPTWVAKDLKAGKPFKVVTDQMRTPTYVMDVCKGIETIIDKELTGDYHLAGSDIVSPYEMAIAVADLLGLDKSLIEPVTADTFKELAKRPLKSGLKIDKAKATFGYDPISFEEGVKKCFERFIKYDISSL
jgi:dTDP-4-dehydrorhamnose reductase